MKIESLRKLEILKTCLGFLATYELKLNNEESISANAVSQLFAEFKSEENDDFENQCHPSQRTSTNFLNLGKK